MLGIAVPILTEFHLIASNINDEELGEYRTYGVEARDENGVYMSKITDVSIDEETVEKFVKCLNEHKLSIEHFEEVVEDFVANL